jgi:hypothetical protein
MTFFKQIPIFLLITVSTTAQDLRREINRDVWIPFCYALANLDTAGYLYVHSKNLIRVERNTGKVCGYYQYAQQIKEGFKQAEINKQKSPDIKFTMELRFLERMASANQAYEVGYYKSSLRLIDGTERKYYSQFHVSLIKEEGMWKILTDSSMPLPGLTEDEFLKAKTL